MNKEILYSILNEELSRPDVERMINSKLSSFQSSRDFKKTVKELAGEVLKEFNKLLWQRSNMWYSSAVRV